MGLCGGGAFERAGIDAGRRAADIEQHKDLDGELVSAGNGHFLVFLRHSVFR